MIHQVTHEHVWVSDGVLCHTNRGEFAHVCVALSQIYWPKMSNNDTTKSSMKYLRNQVSSRGFAAQIIKKILYISFWSIVLMWYFWFWCVCSVNPDPSITMGSEEGRITEKERTETSKEVSDTTGAESSSLSLLSPKLEPKFKAGQHLTVSNWLFIAAQSKWLKIPHVMLDNETSDISEC